MSDNVNMLKQLRSGLKSLGTAKNALKVISDDLISQLPDDKKKEAVALMAKANKGNVDVSEIMNFSSGIRGLNKERFEKAVDESVERVNKKKYNG